MWLLFASTLLLTFNFLSTSLQQQICLQKLESLSEQLLSFPRHLPTNITDLSVLMFSGKGIYDMGSKELCELDSNLRYVLATPYQPAYMGICIYSECSIQVLNQYQDQLIPFLPFPVEYYDDALLQGIKQNYYPGFVGTCTVIAVLLLCGAMGAVVQFSSLFDLRASEAQGSQILQRSEKELHRLKNKCGRFFLTFSFTLNCRKLLDQSPTSGIYDSNLEIFAGVKTLSLIYIILAQVTGSTYISRNIGDLLSEDRQWYGIFLQGSQYSADVFFCTSAFLATYTLIYKYNRSDSFCRFISLAYFHRWYRLVLTLAFVTLLNMYLFLYLVQGPVSVSFYYLSVQNCEDYWWSNLLFINDFYPWQLTKECLTQVWYLANDFQFFLILPLLVPLMRLHKDIANTISVLLLLLSILASLITTYVYHIYLPNTGDHYDNDFYSKPYCRLAAYMVGVILAQLYIDRKQAKLANYEFQNSCGNRFFKFYRRHSSLSWISALLGFSLTTFIIFYYKSAYPVTSWSLATCMVWNALSRPVFVTGMMLVLLPTFEGQLPWLRALLNCGLFKILGKLTYSAFLIQGVIMYAYIASEQNSELGSRDRSVYLFFGLLSLDYIAAWIIYLLCQLPSFNLEKIFLFRSSQLKLPHFLHEQDLKYEDNGLLPRTKENSEKLSESDRNGGQEWVINRGELTKSEKSEESEIHLK